MNRLVPVYSESVQEMMNQLTALRASEVNAITNREGDKAFYCIVRSEFVKEIDKQLLKLHSNALPTHYLVEVLK